MQTSSRYRFVYSCEARPLSASETQVTCLHHSGISQYGGESEPTDKRQGTCFRRLRESLALYPLRNERMGSVIPMKVIEKCIVDTDFPDVDSLVAKYGAISIVRQPYLAAFAMSLIGLSPTIKNSRGCTSFMLCSTYMTEEDADLHTRRMYHPSLYSCGFVD